MSKATSNNNLFCVVYRMGGTANFRWQRTIAASKVETEARCKDVERMGYKAMVVNYDLSMRIGLPETYEYGQPLPSAVDLAAVSVGVEDIAF